MLIKTDRERVLRMSRRVWQDLLTAVLRDPTIRFAQAGVDALSSAQSILLCAGPFVPSAEPPSGQASGDLASWCAVVFVDRVGQVPTIDQLRRQLRPRNAQILTVLCLDTRSPSSGWVGWVLERGDIRPLEGLLIVGPSPIASYRGRTTTLEGEADDSDDSRYSRLQPILNEAFPRVRDWSILLVGSSRSGSLAAMQFAALGIDRLVLVDPDLVELHNLDGMFWATPDDVGRPKALVNAERLVQFRPDMSIQPITLSIRDPKIRLPANCDLLVTCVDDEVARHHAAGLAVRYLLPHLDVATHVTAGSGPANGESRGLELRADVRLVLPGEGCLECIGGGEVTAEMRDFQRFAPVGSLSPDQMRGWDQQRLGSLITLNSIAVSIGVQTWLQYVRGELTGSVWHRVLWSNATDFQVQSGYVRGKLGTACCMLSPIRTPPI